MRTCLFCVNFKYKYTGSIFIKILLSEEIRRQFTDCNVKAIATIEMFMPVAQEVSKSLKDYKGTIWVGGDDDKAKGNIKI